MQGKVISNLHLNQAHRFRINGALRNTSSRRGIEVHK